MSICVIPLYNTPQKYLRQLLDSVLGQTCPNWQLCLADASDAAHGDVAQTVRAYQARDARIVYTKVENKGISANTNAAAALAAGDYLGLADHDDVLAPHAVYEMMKAAHETGAAFFSVQRRGVVHFGRAPAHGRPLNRILRRITSTAAITSAIFPCSERLCSTLWAGWTLLCDGQPDHDLFLKLSERAVPAHVPKVLYYRACARGLHLRRHRGKALCGRGAKRAVAGHLARTGAKGAVVDGLFPRPTRWSMPSREIRFVSILIPNKDHADDLRKALTSIFTKRRIPTMRSFCRREQFRGARHL